MAKSSRKRKKAPAKQPKNGSLKRSAEETKPTSFPTRYVIYGIAVLALAGAGYGFFAAQQEEGAFEAFAAAGQSELKRVETFPNEGRTHVPAGTQINYGTNPPTSGPHFIHWVNPGFYETSKGRSNLVHSLEHGMIVIYYDQPSAEDSETLKRWTALFPGPWSGIVSVRRAGLGEKVILTAWRRILRLDRLETEGAAAFIDAYRGRGPENPVR